jgi:NAD(P)H-dependent flavin oxidoreductase YrpB (nitropropane dioxygenase family)
VIEYALPSVIQGGMGIAISNWHLAKKVSMAGGLGVVSGTAIDSVIARKLQQGDPDKNILRALKKFPHQGMVEKFLHRYYRPEGKTVEEPFALLPKISAEEGGILWDNIILSNFVEVTLAKEEHDRPVGINFLEKIQMANLPAIYGALIAGVDYILMGAGIPREIPSIIKNLWNGKKAKITIDFLDSNHKELTLDPNDFGMIPGDIHNKPRAKFLAIVTTEVLANYLNRDSETEPDGFVVENPSAGGHNAPPRGKYGFNEEGEPVYGPRDIANFEKMKAIGKPFWIAGGFATPEKLAEAKSVGAEGIQVGTVFALSDDSGFEPNLRNRLITQLREGKLKVLTDPKASPTGFPIKVALVEGTQSDLAIRKARPRLCDLGYLRDAYKNAEGEIRYRCPSEPIPTFIKKGGTEAETENRACLCNGLMANIGLEQHRITNYVEEQFVTLGSDLIGPAEIIKLHPDGWTAAQALEYLTA